jgi:hypothetical protein
MEHEPNRADTNDAKRSHSITACTLRSIARIKMAHGASLIRMRGIPT